MDYFENLLARYQSKGVLVDTNLLLVYCIGSYDPRRVPRFKRTMGFTVEDVHTIFKLFTFFNKVVTTPNILTEVNSLANQLPDDLKPSFYVHFAGQLAGLDEHYLKSAKVSSTPQFIKLGLTDSGILDLAQGQYLVLTDDFRLFGNLEKQGIDVINFNHIRTMNWR